MSDLERRLLGQLLGNPAAMEQVWDLGLRSEVFEEPIAAAIYSFIEQYWHAEGRKLTPTPLVISAEFGGIELPVDQDLSTLWLTEQMIRSYSANQIQEMMVEAARISVSDPEGALKLLRERSHSAAESIAPRHSRSNMATSVEARRQRYFERHETGLGRGVTLGLPEIDEHTNGLYPGELAVIGAFSKTGKTMLLCKIATAARRAGLTPVIFSLEMPKEEIEDRIDAMYSGLSYNRLVHSKLTVEEIEILHKLQEELAGLGNLHVEQPAEGERTATAMINRARHLGADYPIIDQLSFMEPGYRVKDLKEHHSVIMKQLKTEINNGAAGRLPCALAVQFNRDSQQRKEGVGLDSFANATEVEATCDLAIGLWRNQEMRTNKTMMAEILGARRSEPGTWQLYWDLVGATSISVLRKL